MKPKKLTPYFNTSNAMGTACIGIAIVKCFFYPSSAFNRDIALLFAGVALHGFAVFPTISLSWKGVVLGIENPSKRIAPITKSRR